MFPRWIAVIWLASGLFDHFHNGGWDVLKALCFGLGFGILVVSVVFGDYAIRRRKDR